MNFDERLSQTQAKLDDIKKKINDSMESAKEANQVKRDEAMVKLAKMNAAIEDLGRDIEAQALCDATSIKNEVSADVDAMNEAADKIGDKIAAGANKIDDALDSMDEKVAAKADEIADALDQTDDEIDAKLNAKADEIDAKVNAKADEIDAKLNAKADEIDEALNKIDEKIDAKVNAKADAIGTVLDEIDGKIDAKINDGLDTIEGDYYAAKEDLRLAKENSESKLNAIRLKIQMHWEEAKAKIDAKKTAVDKAVQEELILDLLDYADDCQMIALSYAIEAELAIIDACNEIEDYDAKYGQSEEA